MSHSKACSKCKQQKPSCEFYKDPRATTGLQSCCIECQKRWNKENSERLAQNKRQWRKSPEVKARIAEYSKQYAAKNKEELKSRRKSYYWKNREKVLKQFNDWAKDNGAKIKINRTQSRKANPALYRSYSATRRARMKNAQTFQITKMEFQKLYSSNCFYCQGTATSIDHVIPLSRGGNHSIGNLVACCLSCNSSKKDKTITEWRYKKLI